LTDRSKTGADELRCHLLAIICSSLTIITSCFYTHSLLKFEPARFNADQIKHFVGFASAVNLPKTVENLLLQTIAP